GASTYSARYSGDPAVELERTQIGMTHGALWEHAKQLVPALAQDLGYVFDGCEGAPYVVAVNAENACPCEEEIARQIDLFHHQVAVAVKHSLVQHESQVAIVPARVRHAKDDRIVRLAAQHEHSRVDICVDTTKRVPERRIDKDRLHSPVAEGMLVGAMELWLF